MWTSVNKKILIATCFILLTSLLIVGCKSEIEDNKEGIHVYGWHHSLGGSEDNLDKTIYSYSINLTNENNQELYIDYISPVLNNTINNKLISNDLKVIVDKTISSGQTIEVKGELVIDTKDMSKKEIIAMEPFVTGVEVISKTTIDLRNGTK